MSSSTYEQVLGVDPSRPAGADDGVALHDVARTADSKRSIRRSDVPADIRQMVREQRMTRADSMTAFWHSASLILAWVALTGGGLAADSLWVWVPVWAMQAFLMHGYYSAMHDAAHGTMFASRGLNRVALFLWALPLGINANLWRCWHLEHHRATVSGDDPEPVGEITNLLTYFGSFPAVGIQMFAEFQGESLMALFGRMPGYADGPSVRNRIRRDALFMVLVTAGVVLAAVFAGHWLLWMWVIPLAAYWCGVSLLIALPEHYHTNKNGTQIDVTRSTTSNKLLSFIVWNSNRHAAHHLLPTLNYRYLAVVDDALGDRVEHRAVSYTRYHWSILRELVGRSR
jgi:fatty acid desaturase